VGPHGELQVQHLAEAALSPSTVCHRLSFRRIRYIQGNRAGQGLITAPPPSKMLAAGTSMWMVAWKITLSKTAAASNAAPSPHWRSHFHAPLYSCILLYTLYREPLMEYTGRA
jgi:hypothetical protein